MKQLVPSFLILAGLILSGCGGSGNVEKAQRYVWPPPPEEERIVYVGTHTGERDYPAALGGVLSAIGGESQKLSLTRPFDLCIDGRGRILVTDINQGVVVFDTAHHKVFLLGEKCPISLAKSRGIAWGHGKTFIGLNDAGRVAVLAGMNGDSLVGYIGRQGTFQNPIDIICDTARSRVIIVDYELHNVYLYSEAGDSLMTLGKRGEGDGEFNHPQAAAVDSAGNIYVADGFNFRIQVFNKSGAFVRKFGRQGNYWGMFERMKGIALDTYGNIYVLDALHQSFTIFDNSGKLLLTVGQLSGGNDGFQNPVSLYIDAQDFIYVTDQVNSRVQVFKLVNGN